MGLDGKDISCTEQSLDANNILAFVSENGTDAMERLLVLKKGDHMKKGIGLWIDHRKAVVVLVSGEGEVVKEITSHMEKHVRFSEGSTTANSSEDVRDRQFGNHLNSYYDAVIAVIRDGDSIQIFGPGEAKGELKKRLESNDLGGRIAGMETVDKMTDRQIAAKVREHLKKI
jgi:hypothetical protein